MKILLTLGIFCYSLFTGIGQTKINGIGFVSSQNKISSKDVLPLIGVNTNSVAINPFAFVRGIDNPKIVYKSDHSWYGETKEGIIQYAIKNEPLVFPLNP